MLSAGLIQMIEDHAEELTLGLIKELQSNKRTTHYHRLSRDELHHRTYNVYKNLGHWLSSKTEESIESNYTDLAKQRYAEGIPLHEVVHALILTKDHLREYIRCSGLLDSAIDLYREREVLSLVGSFYDKAIYYTVSAYESVAGMQPAREAAKRAA